METAPRAVPSLTLLNEEQIQLVHLRSLEILRRVGVRVDSPQALDVFRGAPGARLDQDRRVLLDPELIEWAIETAPAVIEVFDRMQNPVFRLGEGRTRFGVGVTNLYYQEPLDDRVRPFTRQDMALGSRLGGALAGFDLVSTIGILQDYPPESADHYAALEMVANTTKPLILLVSNEGLFSDVLDLLENLTGERQQDPCFIPYFNPITPLVINPGTADKMLETVRRGYPLIFSNYSMAGMTTPITPAGALALMNAELLAGLALAQLARPGAGVILGSLPAYFDMRTMQDFYDPKSFLINLACAEMMAHYGLPHAGTSGSGLGWGPDLGAAGLQWFNHLASLLGKSGLAPFVGGNLGSKVFCPALVVYADEVIGQVLRFWEGFELDVEAFGLEDIVQAGPGGSFLDSELTMKHFKRACFESRLSPRWSLERWQQRGEPQMVQLLRERTVQLLEEAVPPEDHRELLDKGEAFIRTVRI
ncbi:MAG: trimethylamine methyltransferase family protein [Anaerolineales bacterium]|nr:trimethylamine methyltransferase family protein [Anaerolineales bacterium]